MARASWSRNVSITMNNMRPPWSRGRIGRSAPDLVPVAAGGREDRRAAGRLGGPVQRVRGRPPHGVVRHGAMGLQRGLVTVDLEEVVDVLVLLVLEHVEARAPRLVPLGAERVHLDRLQELLAKLGLDP